MHKVLLFVLSLFIFTNIYSQEYKKDTRNQFIKDDALKMYNAHSINNVDLLKALSLLGVQVFKFDIGEFQQEYKISITMDEYLNGEKINSKEIIKGNNIYYYSTDSIYTENSEIFYDYINQLSFYVNEKDSIVNITFSDYSTDTRLSLHKKKEREPQFYSWRYYRDSQWKLNENVPLLVYASSWLDNKSNIERFCGVATLSVDDEDTTELLRNSPHYFCFNFKVTNKK